jgi:hypothetical protein
LRFKLKADFLFLLRRRLLLASWLPTVEIPVSKRHFNSRSAILIIDLDKILHDIEGGAGGLLPLAFFLRLSLARLARFLRLVRFFAVGFVR